MLRPAMNEMIENTRDSYSFVVAIAKRARDLAIDAEERNEIIDEKPVAVAVAEFYDHPWDISFHVKER